MGGGVWVGQGACSRAKQGGAGARRHRHEPAAGRGRVRAAGTTIRNPELGSAGRESQQAAPLAYPTTPHTIFPQNTVAAWNTAQAPTSTTSAHQTPSHRFSLVTQDN